jgi:hypothetical protein
MTEADGSVDPAALAEWRWDVALSFAGAQRDYVDQVTQALKARGVRCFYDADEEIDLWGKYLAEELPAIYGEQAAAVVIFVSAEYAARDWTRHERRAALGRAVRERREYVLPARFDDTPLPGLLPDLSYVDLRGRTPQQFAGMIAAKLASLGIRPSSSPGEAGRGPPGAIRVREADPRRLGVHAAISLPGLPDEVPPEYVARDADAAEQGVRAKVAAAAERGGLVLLVGGSSVGKTRSAVEAVKALLPDWWLVYPAGPGEVAALARASAPRTVVWLDELQRYLGGEDGLTGAAVRALLNAPHPAVIIGTLWPDRYTVYTTVPSSSGTDPYTREREVLDLAEVIRIDPEFSPAEQGRARAAAARDRRLRVALESAGYGLTQTLAAAPQLVARWQDATTASPYGWAVLTAALDAARLGARAPLSVGFLRSAAPGYCTSQQQAEAPQNWFNQALDYATGTLYGAAAALSPAGAGMGQIAGYIVADYLIQHAGRERRYARVPASTWDAALSHIRDRADATRLADSARDRLLYRYAVPLYRHAADAGDSWAAERLDYLLARRQDLEELRTRADAGDKIAAADLAGLLARRGDLDGMRALADTGTGMARVYLAAMLGARGDLEELRTRADAGDEAAAARLAELLARRDPEELRARADAGDEAAARKLADLRTPRRGLSGPRATGPHGRAAGDTSAARPLTDMSGQFGDPTGRPPWADAADALRAHAITDKIIDDWRAQWHGNLDRLRAEAGAGDRWAARMLADLLAERGDIDEALQVLRAAVATGDPHAAEQLARLLAERGDLDGAAQVLLARADAGDELAAGQLARLLAERGDLDGLRARADVGDQAAAARLADLLAEHGDLDGLRARAAAGDQAAARLLAEGLTKQGREEDAERLQRFGLAPDGSIACE